MSVFAMPSRGKRTLSGWEQAGGSGGRESRAPSPPAGGGRGAGLPDRGAEFRIGGRLDRWLSVVVDRALLRRLVLAEPHEARPAACSRRGSTSPYSTSHTSEGATQRCARSGGTATGASSVASGASFARMRARVRPSKPVPTRPACRSSPLSITARTSAPRSAGAPGHRDPSHDDAVLPSRELELPPRAARPAHVLRSAPLRDEPLEPGGAHGLEDLRELFARLRRARARERQRRPEPREERFEELTTFLELRARAGRDRPARAGRTRRTRARRALRWHRAPRRATPAALGTTGAPRR